MDILITFASDLIRLWNEGGILMWPLMFIAIFIYWHVFELFSNFTNCDYSLDKSTLLKDILEDQPNVSSMRAKLKILKAEYLPYFNQRIHFLSILAGVSPLMGLLGTVMGMLATFTVMNSGDVQKVDLMAGGISQALITTQIGLIIAVPALIMIMMLRAKRDNLKQLFDQLEVDCYKKITSDRGGAS